MATILWPEEEEAEYSIYDMLGRLVDRAPIRLLGGAEEQRIYFRGLAAGTYIFIITSARHSASTRFVNFAEPGGSSGSSSPSFIKSLKDSRDGSAMPAATSSAVFR